MKQLLLAVSFLVFFTTSARASKLVYLEDGSVIKAQKVWRSSGQVHVLVNRDTLVDFNSSEINIKKTFPKKQNAARKNINKAPTPEIIVTGSKVVTSQPEKKKTAISQPKLTSLPEKSPEVLSGKEEGSIRKHKREMAEKIGE